MKVGVNIRAASLDMIAVGDFIEDGSKFGYVSKISINKYRRFANYLYRLTNNGGTIEVIIVVK